MTRPSEAAEQAASYYRALLDVDVPPDAALAFTVAYIQAQALADVPTEPETRPRPTRVRD